MIVDEASVTSLLIFSSFAIVRCGRIPFGRVSGKRIIIIGTGVCTSLYTGQEVQVGLTQLNYLVAHDDDQLHLSSFVCRRLRHCSLQTRSR